MWTPSAELQRVLDRARTQRQTIVLVTGVFDLLHAEHRNFLHKAKEEGEVLIIGIETDNRVRALKGEGRPVHSQIDRQANLEALRVAAAVFLLPEEFSKQEDYINLIEQIKPHVLAVSSHSPYMENKQKIMAQFGGVVKVVHDHNPAISTTQILEAQRRQGVLR